MDTSGNSSIASPSPELLVKLAEALSQVTDPRAKRGVRHPFSGILALVFLGMLARIREMAVLERWAKANWDILAEPLGFTRKHPPCDTTFSRTLADFSLAEFRQAFSHWLREAVPDFQESWAGAVDGKTAKQSLDAAGNPIHMLNVFLQKAKVTLDQWSVSDEKTNEPSSLKTHLAELLSAYPMLHLLTGDAIYAQRPLINVLRASGCDYLFQVKENQGDLLDALHACFQDAAMHRPQHETTEKRGETKKRGGSGSTWTTSSTSVSV